MNQYKDITIQSFNSISNTVKTALPKPLIEEFDHVLTTLKQFVQTETSRGALGSDPISSSILEPNERKSFYMNTKDKIKNVMIPFSVLKKCKGIAIVSILKGGFVVSARTGTGLVLARLPDGDWSAPFGISISGMGIGWQIGADITDTVFILNTDEAVQAFFKPKYTLGGQLGLAAGPIGRSAEIAGDVETFAPIYTYSISKGLYAGISFEGSLIAEREIANLQFYKLGGLTGERFLNGDIIRPKAAAPLYTFLYEYF